MEMTPDQNRLIKTHLYVDVGNANKRILVGLSTSTVFIPSGAKCRNRLTVGVYDVSSFINSRRINKIHINASCVSIVSAPQWPRLPVCQSNFTRWKKPCR